MSLTEKLLYTKPQFLSYPACISEEWIDEAPLIEIKNCLPMQSGQADERHRG